MDDIDDVDEIDGVVGNNVAVRVGIEVADVVGSDAEVERWVEVVIGKVKELDSEMDGEVVNPIEAIRVLLVEVDVVSLVVW